MFDVCVVRAVRTYRDGCRMLVFDWPDWLPRTDENARKIPGMIIGSEAEDGAVSRGSRVESEHRDDGAPFDGESCLRYRIDDGPWLDSHDGSEHEHDHDTETVPLLRDVLRAETARTWMTCESERYA